MKQPMPKAPTFKDVEFMTAAQKTTVFKAWFRFLKSGLAKTLFTEALYHHLSQHASFIAHFNRHGFFEFYFEDGREERALAFLSQFDPDLPGISVEYGDQHWLRMDEYFDLNDAMRDAARPFLPGLRDHLTKTIRSRDLAQAHALLSKHNKL